jgi:hypothetical protein
MDEHDPRLAQVRWRQRAAQQDLQLDRRQCRLLPYGPCRPNRSAGTRRWLPNPTISEV